MRLKRLCAETHAVYAIFGKHVDLLGVKSTRVCLDGEFTVRFQRQPARDCLQQPGKPASIQISWRPSTEKERRHAFGLAERSQFSRQGFDVQIDLMILSGSDREITIATMMSAKRDMNIRCTGPEPRREPLWSR